MVSWSNTAPAHLRGAVLRPYCPTDGQPGAVFCPGLPRIHGPGRGTQRRPAQSLAAQLHHRHHPGVAAGVVDADLKQLNSGRQLDAEPNRSSTRSATACRHRAFPACHPPPVRRWQWPPDPFTRRRPQYPLSGQLFEQCRRQARLRNLLICPTPPYLLVSRRFKFHLDSRHGP